MMINTVTGQVDTCQLGYTLMHEHIYLANHTMSKVFPDWVNHDEFIVHAVELIQEAKSYGVKTIVDATPFQLGRDAKVMKEVAEKAEINIIAATGYHWFEDLCLVDKGSEFLAERMIKDIECGMEDTDIKANIIKCATDKFGLDDFAKRIIKAAIITQKATGVPMLTHTCSKQGAIEQMDFFEENGLDPAKIVIGHIGDYNDVAFMQQVADRGFYIGHDRFGVDMRHPESLSSQRRAETVAELWQNGYGEKIVLSHDSSCFIDYWEGQHDLGNPWETAKNMPQHAKEFCLSFLSKHGIPMMKELGLTQKEFDTMLIETPQRMFEK